VTDDELLDNEHQIIGECIDFLAPFHHPIFLSDDAQEPYLTGTGFILDINRRRFFCTAAHVANDVIKRGFFVGFNLLYSAPCAFFKSTGDKDDNIDIAVMEVTNLEYFDAMRAIPLNMISPEPEEKRGVFIFIGYPQTKQRKNFKEINTFKISIFGFYNALCSENEYEALEVTSQQHIAVRFDKKRCWDKDGKQFTFPNPQGMSGGGIWRYGPNSRSPVLCGLSHENPGQKKFFLGTSIHRILAFIFKTHPDLTMFG
jgi:hypothetical protein